MVEYRNEQQLDSLFHALADRTRRGLLSQLSTKPQRVTELAAHFDMSLNAVSKHLKVLERAELISRNVQGRVHLCRFEAERLRDIENWLQYYTKFWNQKLDALEDFVTKKNPKPGRTK